MIAIVDGCGKNIASVQFALERLGKKSVLTVDKDIILSASHVILPGVGTAKHAMSQLGAFQLVDVIAQLQQPVLGICLGMQLLFEFSAEDDSTCLDILPGKVARLPQNEALTIPHMGWNQLKASGKESRLMNGVMAGSYAYFVHSYAVAVNENTTAITRYGSPFTSIVEKNNFYGVQFHPEKSGKMGEIILKNFLSL